MIKGEMGGSKPNTPQSTRSPRPSQSLSQHAKTKIKAIQRAVFTLTCKTARSNVEESRASRIYSQTRNINHQKGSTMSQSCSIIKNQLPNDSPYVKLKQMIKAEKSKSKTSLQTSASKGQIRQTNGAKYQSPRKKQDSSGSLLKNNKHSEIRKVQPVCNTPTQGKKLRVKTKRTELSQDTKRKFPKKIDYIIQDNKRDPPKKRTSLEKRKDSESAAPASIGSQKVSPQNNQRSKSEAPGMESILDQNINNLMKSITKQTNQLRQNLQNLSYVKPDVLSASQTFMPSSRFEGLLNKSLNDEDVQITESIENELEQYQNSPVVLDECIQLEIKQDQYDDILINGQLDLFEQQRLLQFAKNQSEENSEMKAEITVLEKVLKIMGTKLKNNKQQQDLDKTYKHQIEIMKTEVNSLMQINTSLIKEKGELKKKAIKCIEFIREQTIEFDNQIAEQQTYIDELLIGNKSYSEQLQLQYDLYSNEDTLKKELRNLECEIQIQEEDVSVKEDQCKQDGLTELIDTARANRSIMGARRGSKMDQVVISNNIKILIQTNLDEKMRNQRRRRSTTIDYSDPTFGNEDVVKIEDEQFLKQQKSKFQRYKSPDVIGSPLEKKGGYTFGELEDDDDDDGDGIPKAKVPFEIHAAPLQIRRGRYQSPENSDSSSSSSSSEEENIIPVVPNKQIEQEQRQRMRETLAKLVEDATKEKKEKRLLNQVKKLSPEDNIEEEKQKQLEELEQQDNEFMQTLEGSPLPMDAILLKKLKQYGGNQIIEEDESDESSEGYNRKSSLEKEEETGEFMGYFQDDVSPLDMFDAPLLKMAKGRSLTLKPKRQISDTGIIKKQEVRKQSLDDPKMVNLIEITEERKKS